MAKSITIYTTNTCAYCVMVKRWLKGKGLSFKEVNLEDQPERQAEMMQLSGQMAVPVTVVADKDIDYTNVTIGWNPAKLAAAIADMQPGAGAGMAA
jgi:glutaredoxin